jgi:uncharacterized FAD-dependent dehydrogenase
MLSSLDVDLLIIGAGPAGLSAAIACQRTGVDFRVIESGLLVDERDHAKEEDLGRGVGGAGLYSDGKFSFFPSASSLWTISPRSDLELAYRWVNDVLRPQLIPVPDFPSPSSLLTAIPRTSSGIFDTKPYPSFYANLDRRLALISELQQEVLANVLPAARAIELKLTECGCLVRIRRDLMTMPTVLRTKYVILATGRFGPILIQKASNVPTVFRRVEVGTRIQQKSAHFFLRGCSDLDPKLTMTNERGDVEWRTFCCCREGEIVAIKDAGFNVLSGRSDVHPTGFSNVGFHVRFTDPDNAGDIWKDMTVRLGSAPDPAQMSLLDFIDAPDSARSPLGHLLGLSPTSALVEGLRKLVAQYGRHTFDGATLHGPTLEGFAYYPKVGRDLKLAGLPVWAAGDVTGIFRGIVAALVSGYFSGLQAGRALGAHS